MKADIKAHRALRILAEKLRIFPDLPLNALVGYARMQTT